jgi:LysM repeat protein
VYGVEAVRSPFASPVRRRVRAAVASALLAVSLAFGVAPAVHAADKATKHEVAEGQSLWKIARRYNVSVVAIQRANDLEEDAPIQPGMVLRIPSKAEAKRLEDAAEKEQKREKKREKKDDDRADRKAKASEDDARGRDEKKKIPWWQEKPTEASQTQKTPAERGGVNPCLTDDPGWGIYDGWSRGITMGQMTMPGRGGVTKSGSFDVIFHFHGHEAARKEWVEVMDGTVLVGITLGIGSGAYSSAFSSPHVFDDLLESVEREVAAARGLKKAKARKIGLSGWSAGYGAVEMILRSRASKIDTVILLDGLHAGYGPDGVVQEAQLEPFLAFARKAKAGQKFMFVSHSSIIPPGYASTTETASWLIMKLGGKPKKSRPRASDPMGLELNRRWDAGNFHVRGYDGNDKMDHCAHFGVLHDVLRVHVKKRFHSPRGYAPKKGDGEKKKAS